MARTICVVGDEISSYLHVTLLNRPSLLLACIHPRPYSDLPDEDLARLAEE